MAQEHAELLGAADTGDVVGWTYRKDWFERPELQAEFRPSTAVISWLPTFTELKDIAEFFQNRTIDGKTVYGASIYTERGSEGHHHGRDGRALQFWLQIRKPREAI